MEDKITRKDFLDKTVKSSLGLLFGSSLFFQTEKIIEEKDIELTKKDLEIAVIDTDYNRESRQMVMTVQFSYPKKYSKQVDTYLKNITTQCPKDLTIGFYG